ncbi:cytochrome c oxidase assembly protein [Acetobacter nitrogenifigens DSM 23921 = NBRC 105050]|uniref:Heme A synthase n=2 Tax=Acetobacter nitrogenifigens TaxID=285268 RepID=A0A511X8Z4_9PROT|nr:cytochrome c oxidase assembly protein [Acetobacter nitrogenifigens DSM 23921 = NBRC 105050]GEN59404.1 heme A synthase [Acetobacter nitrogenifigens DSM 23921 = NBRC 105050]
MPDAAAAFSVKAQDSDSIPLDGMTPRDRRRVSNWLLTICVMLLGMIALGGATRLTGSGLSIMDWRPVTGILPPLSHAEWERQFELYKGIPQYKILHDGFGLAGFQKIFWAEWTHRFWGRMIGLYLLLRLVWFAATGVLTRALILRLALFFVLGGLQGAIGWFMVASGFRADSTAVEPVRLVLHLSAAFILYVAILWTALSIRFPRPSIIPDRQAGRRARAILAVAIGLISLTIIAGGFTAGTHAGFSYNTFPLMEGRLIPEGYGKLSPFWFNWIANIPAVQFDHRLLATLTALCVGLVLLIGARANLGERAHRGVILLGWAVLAQYALGVTTLLLVVPVPVATLHQTFAAVLLSVAVFTLHALRGVGRAS